MKVYKRGSKMHLVNHTATTISTTMLFVEAFIKVFLASLYNSSMAVTKFLRTLTRAPTVEKDRGYAWVILTFACLSDSVHMYAMLSNLTVAHKELFSISTQMSSSIGSVHVGLLLLFGKFQSHLNCLYRQSLLKFFKISNIGHQS